MAWNVVKQTSFYAAVAALIFIAVFPFYYAIITSFKSGTALFEVSYLPTTFSFANYISLFVHGNFVINLLNSAIVATSVVALALLFGMTAAFALSRVRFRGRNMLLVIILGVSMFPQIAVLPGLYELVRNLGLINKLYALVLAYMIFTLPFTVWVLTTFMRDIPVEIEEAAIVDGASPWTIIRRVFLPLMWPAIVTTCLLAFIAAWNEYLFALTFTSSDTERTVPVAIASISGASEHEIPWGAIMAASCIVTVPLIVLVLAFQRKIISGLTAGGVKG